MDYIYVRGSDERINTDNQLFDLQRVCPAGVIYKDVMSGSRQRPMLERLLNTVKKGDTVWIWSLDRLTREGIHATLSYLKRATGVGARIRSYKESWMDSDSPMWEMMVSCMAFGARLERDRLIERTRLGLARGYEERAARRRAEGRPYIDKEGIRTATGPLAVIARQFGCSIPYVCVVRKKA